MSALPGLWRVRDPDSQPFRMYSVSGSLNFHVGQPVLERHVVLSDAVADPADPDCGGARVRMPNGKTPYVLVEPLRGYRLVVALAENVQRATDIRRFGPRTPRVLALESQPLQVQIVDQHVRVHVVRDGDG